MYHIISEVIGKVSEEEFSFRKEDVNADQLIFFKQFVKIFMPYFKYCLGSKNIDSNSAYQSTNSQQSNKDFSQVYKKNPKYLALNINQSKFENPPDIQKAFTFSQQNAQASLNSQQQINQDNSFLQKKYTFNFNFDENLLTNQSPYCSKKNLHQNKSQTQQKQSSTAKKQQQNKQNQQEIIKHNTTIDLTHLRQNIFYDEPNQATTQKQFQQYQEQGFKSKDQITTQKKSQSKSPISSSQKFNHFQRLQEFSDQYVNTSLISRNENTINKENKDQYKKLMKDNSNLSLIIKSSDKRSSLTPNKSFRAQPSSTKVANYQKERSGSSKSPQTVRTHLQILKTKRIEPYEKVIENLNNLQNQTPIDLTPRKQTKPFN